MDDNRPKFLPSFLDLVRKEAELSGWKAVFPYVLIIVLVLSTALAYMMPDDFWTDRRWDVSTAVYSGILTFNGLILALGWAAFSRRYDVLLRGEFGKYLASRNLLNNYLVHITSMHIVQIMAVAAAGIALVSVLLDGFPLWMDRVIFAIVAGLMIYSIKQATIAVIGMNDLVWQSAFFETSRPSKDNVTPIKPSSG